MALQFDSTLNFIHQPSISTGNELVWYFPEGSGATFVRNDIVKATSGQLQIGTAGAEVMIGCADIAKTGVQGALIPVRVFRPSDIYVGFYQSDDTPVSADLNLTGFDVIRPSAGIWRIDQDDTTNPKVMVLGRANMPSLVSGAAPILEAAATAGMPVYCRFLNAVLHFGT